MQNQVFNEHTGLAIGIFDSCSENKLDMKSILNQHSLNKLKFKLFWEDTTQHYSGGSRIFLRGPQLQKWEYWCIILQLFCQKRHEIERIWIPRWGVRPWRPLGSANAPYLKISIYIMLTYGYIEFELTDTISKVKVILIDFQYQLHKNINIASIVRKNIDCFSKLQRKRKA